MAPGLWDYSDEDDEQEPEAQCKPAEREVCEIIDSDEEDTKPVAARKRRRCAAVKKSQTTKQQEVDLDLDDDLDLQLPKSQEDGLSLDDFLAPPAKKQAKGTEAAESLAPLQAPQELMSARTARAAARQGAAQEAGSSAEPSQTTTQQAAPAVQGSSHGAVSKPQPVAISLTDDDDDLLDVDDAPLPDLPQPQLPILWYKYQMAAPAGGAAQQGAGAAAGGGSSGQPGAVGSSSAHAAAGSAAAAAGEPAAAAGAAEPKIRVVCQYNGGKVQVNISSTGTVEKLIKAFMKGMAGKDVKVPENVAAYKVVFDGITLKPQETVGEAGIEDEEMVDVSWKA